MSARHDLVLVPGLICDAAVWQYQTAHLEDVASVTVPSVDAQETMADMARSVLARAPEKFALAGFSMGGYVALEVLRQAPERVTRLCLVDTSARGDTPEKRAWRENALAMCQRGQYADVIAGMIKILLHPEHQREPMLGFVRAMTERIGSGVFERRQRAQMTRSDSRELLAGTPINVRVICGRQDAMSSLPEHTEIAQLAPRGRLSIIEECGHMAPVERPHAVSALMRDWLVYD
jgi:pimeloyl-ACP methyl ester carboxylesterase